MSGQNLNNRSNTRMARYCVPTQTATLSTATPPTGTAIDYRSFAAGNFWLGSGIQASTWTLYGCDTFDGTYVALYDSAGNAVTITIGGASRSYPIPSACAGVPFIKISSNLDNDESITVSLKG